MSKHEIGLITLGYVEHLRPHLDTRRRHREGAQLKPFLLLQNLDDRQRFLAGGIVVIHIGDLFALRLPPS